MSAFRSAGLDTVHPSQTRYMAHDLEVSLLRRELRASGMTSNPCLSRRLCSVSGTMLDESLASMKETCNSNYMDCKQSFFESGAFSRVKLRPIYYTPEERMKKESIENQTKAEIEKKIIALVDTMPCAESASVFRDFIKAVKSKKKEKYIELYYDVVSSLTEQLAHSAVETIQSETLEVDENS